MKNVMESMQRKQGFRRDDIESYIKRGLERVTQVSNLIGATSIKTTTRRRWLTSRRGRHDLII